MRDLLLVPSARLVPAELQTEFGPIPSCLIPLDSRPSIRYIAELNRDFIRAALTTDQLAKLPPLEDREE